MTVFNEPRLSFEFLVSEQPGYISRDSITVASGSGVVVPGTVLAKSVASSTATSAVKASGANTGNGTLTPDVSTPVLVGAMPGTYQVRLTSSTAYSVTDPNGGVVGTGVVGTAFVNQIKFNTAAGGTAFVAGDGFDVAVNLMAKYVPCVASANDGTSTAVAITLLQADTTAGDAIVSAVTSGAEVVGAMLTYDASISTPALIAAKSAHLNLVRIKVR